MVQILHQLERRNHCLPVARNIRKTRKRSGDAFSPIAAQLTGSNTATALGLTGRGNAPVIDLCCKLSDAGYNPAAGLHVYRATRLALKVRSIGEGVKLTVEDNHLGKPVFRPQRNRPQNDGAGPPIALANSGHGFHGCQDGYQRYAAPPLAQGGAR